MSADTREMTFPNEIPIDPDKGSRSIFVHQNQGLFAPSGIANSLRESNKVYTRDKLGRLQFMADSVFTLGGNKGSFMHSGTDATSEDLLVVFSPLNDGQPESEPSRVLNVISKPDATFFEVAKAAPNSWRPAAKLFSDYQFGKTEGVNIPRLQIFAREAPGMSRDQRHRVSQGDMTPYGEIALPAIQRAERIMRENYSHEGFKRIHFFAAGMGAKALGAAVHLSNSVYSDRIAGVTLMNFSLGEQGSAKRLVDYAGRSMTGKASNLILPKDYVSVPEFDLLSELDMYTEPSMRKRQVAAMVLNPWILKSIMNAHQGVEYIEQLLNQGSTITVANGLNEPATSLTEHFIPKGNAGLHLVDIVGVDGKKVGQAANEHGVTLAVVSNLGIYNQLKDAS